MRQVDPVTRETLRTLFEELEARDHRYVVLRKYELLPDAVADDVDLLVEAAAFEATVDLCTALGFERPPDAGGPTPLQRAVRRPFRTVATVLSSPGTVRRAFGGGSDGAEESGGVADAAASRRKLVMGRVELDLVDHLHSPEVTGPRVPPAFERALLERRRRRDGVYVPAPPDELAHVVVHCLADYGGEFPPYYVCRCETLRKTVAADPGARAQFEEQLGRLLGDDAGRFAAAVLDGSYGTVQDAGGLPTAESPA